MKCKLPWPLEVLVYPPWNKGVDRRGSFRRQSSLLPFL